MKRLRKTIAVITVVSLICSLCACSNKKEEQSSDEQEEQTINEGKKYIEEALNLANNENQEWTYSENSDAWTLFVMSAVAYPKLMVKSIQQTQLRSF